MENLPHDLLPSVLIYLETSHIFTSIVKLNRSFHETTKSIGFLRSLVQRDFYIQRFLEIGQSSCMRLLKEGLKLETESYEYLDFKGYATDGGVDEDNPSL